jgi:hypothetical protein
METERELTWKAAADLFAAERHFNQMQNHCRTLASTWLLAAFAGIGFLFKERPFSDTHLAAALVALAAGGGIFLLWILDVKVWHRLLLANSLAGYRIERENTWLPKVRLYISETKGRFPVRVHLSFFYSLAIVMLTLIAAAFLSRASTLGYPWPVATTTFLAGGAVAGAMVRAAFASAKRDSDIMKAIDNRIPPTNTDGDDRGPGAA